MYCKTYKKCSVGMISNNERSCEWAVTGVWQVWSYIWVWAAGCGNKKGGRRVKGDIRRNASNNWVGREGAGCSQAEHSSLAAGRPTPVRRARGERWEPLRCPATCLPPLSGRCLPSVFSCSCQPLAQFQTSLAKQLTVGRESLTSIAPHSVLAAGHKQKQEIRLPC